jgi:hypothetical protein
MTKQSGGPTVNRDPAPEPDRDKIGEVAGNAREKGEDPSPDDRERGETPDSDPCTAHDRAS